MFIIMIRRSDPPRILCLAALSLALLLPASVQAQTPETAPAAAVCLAIMPATVTGVENGSEAATAVQEVFVSFLTGPTLNPVALESRLKVQAAQEAKQKGCGYLITATVHRKRSGGGSALGRVVGQAAGHAAWYIPGGHTVGTGVARGLSIGAAQALSTMASSTRAKDEMQMEWALTVPAGATIKSKSEKLKASSDGEDVLTPLVQRAAESIAELVIK